MYERLREDRFGKNTGEMKKPWLQKNIERLEAQIIDLEQCLAGNPKSTKWQEINIHLTNIKGQLLNEKRRFAGRNPNMKSWADPLPS